MVGINLDVLFHTWTGRNHLLGFHLISVVKDEEKARQYFKTDGSKISKILFIKIIPRQYGYCRIIFNNIYKK
jgi:hypothetical protein